MNDETPTTTSNEISDAQWIVLYGLQIFSSTLSIMGSSLLTIKIMRDLARYKSITSYDRIILALSCTDILASLTYATNQFLWPPETGYTWAFGNSVTCPIVGFFQQMAPPWFFYYNCALSCYFLLTVLSQKRKTNYVKKFEKWLHLVGLFFPATAILGLIRGWYDEEEGFCEITDPIVVLTVVAMPLAVFFLSQIVTNVAIYAIVHKALQLPERIYGHTLGQKRLKREAATIILLYIGTCFITGSPFFLRLLLVLIFGYGFYDTRLFPLLVLESFLLPLQGFFNFFIYIKPAYTRFRAAYPDESLCSIVYQALYNPKTPRISYHPRMANLVTAAETEGGGTVDITLRNANSSRMFYNPNKILFNVDVESTSSEISIPIFSDNAKAETKEETKEGTEEETKEETEGEN